MSRGGDETLRALELGSQLGTGYREAQQPGDAILPGWFAAGVRRGYCSSIATGVKSAQRVWQLRGGWTPWRRVQRT